MEGLEILFWMTNDDGDRKPVVRADAEDELKREGWVREDGGKKAAK